MASRAELLDIAHQALAEGDEATAQAAMDAAEKQVSQQDQPKKDEYQGDKLQIFNPFGENIQTPIPLGGNTEKFMQGMGQGFSEVGRGVKNLTGFGEENINAESDKALTDNSGYAMAEKSPGTHSHSYRLALRQWAAQRFATLGIKLLSAGCRALRLRRVLAVVIQKFSEVDYSGLLLVVVYKLLALMLFAYLVH